MNKTWSFGALALVFSLALVGCGNHGGADSGIEYSPQMYHAESIEPYAQQKYNPYSKDGKNLREPVSGTVARGKAGSQYSGLNVVKDSAGRNIENRLLSFTPPTPNTAEGYEAATRLKNPLPRTAENVAEGKRLFNLYCSHCHGEDGGGQGSIVRAGKFPPVPAYNGQLKKLVEGKMFHTITHGKGLMGSHASQLTPEERWKVIFHIQDLQATGGAPEEKKEEAVKKDSTKK